jgi:hypothetical protein
VISQGWDMNKLSDAQIGKIYAPFGQKPCAETAQAILDEPLMPLRLQKLAFNYTDDGQKARAEGARQTVSVALRSLLGFSNVLTAEQIEGLEQAVELVSDIAKSPAFAEGAELRQAEHVRKFLDNCNRGN